MSVMWVSKCHFGSLIITCKFLGDVITHLQIQGMPPQTGPNSLIFAYISAGKHPHQESAPPNVSGHPHKILDLLYTYNQKYICYKWSRKRKID